MLGNYRLTLPSWWRHNAPDQRTAPTTAGDPALGFITTRPLAAVVAVTVALIVGLNVLAIVVPAANVSTSTSSASKPASSAEVHAVPPARGVGSYVLIASIALTLLGGAGFVLWKTSVVEPAESHGEQERDVMTPSAPETTWPNIQPADTRMPESQMSNIGMTDSKGTDMPGAIGTGVIESAEPAAVHGAPLLMSPEPPTLDRLARLRSRYMIRVDHMARMIEKIEAEAAPLLRLMSMQDALEQRFAANLERNLRPLAQYADLREESLRALIASTIGDGTSAPRPLAVDTQREREQIEEIRADIARQEREIRAGFEAERNAIDAALALFDVHAEEMDEQLSAAQHAVGRMNEGMHSAAFAQALDALEERAQRLAERASMGASSMSDLAELARSPGTVMERDADSLAQAASSLRTVIDALSSVSRLADEPSEASRITHAA